MEKLTRDDLIVTTPAYPAAEDRDFAGEVAERLGLAFHPRHRDTVNRIVRRCGAKAALVAGCQEIYLLHDKRKFRFHPGMAVHRVHSLQIGKKDRLVEAAELESGDAFLDCTCGLGADAVVAAYAAGEKGRVRALEASSLLASIVEFGLSRYTHNKADLTRAMRRVEVQNRDYARALPELETESWDVVYFDPMFQRTVPGARSLDLVHLLARDELPGPEAVSEALRVARRCVVVKDRYPGNFLRAMDIPVITARQRICYGRLDAGSPAGSSR